MNIIYQVAAITNLDILMEFVKEFHEFEKLPFDERIDRDVVKRIITDSSLGRVWLIQLGDEVIGYVVLTLGYSIEYRGRDAFVDELYIRSDYRRQGVGTKTLQFVEDACRSLDVKALHLEVGKINTKAQQFYKKVGYEDHERYLMTKWLSNLSD